MRTSLRLLLAGALFVASGIIGNVRAETLRLSEATFSDLQRALRSGDVTSVDLVALYLNRIQTYDRRGPRLRAVAQLNPLVFVEAEAADRRRTLGQPTGPLDGLPFLVKDSYDMAGLAAAAGARPLKRNFVGKDAPVVAALRRAGAIGLGKSNMWAFAYAVPPDPDSRYAWGRVRNPYTGLEDFGGSSTGSAAAVAANLCAFAMGGDTGSSIRLPSARTALVGGRPSLFLLPTSGIIPANVTLDVIGPMTRTVEDLARVMDVVVFDDPAPITRFFPPASRVRPRTYTAKLRRDALQGKVVGLPKPYIGTDNTGKARPLDPVIQPLWDAAVQRLQALGATTKEIDWPFFHNVNGDNPAQGFASVGLTETQFRDTWQWCDAHYFNEHLKAYRFRPVPDLFALPRWPSSEPAIPDKIAGYKEYLRKGLAKPYPAYEFSRYFAAFRRWAARDVTNVMAQAGVDLLAFPVSGGDDPANEAFEPLNGVYEGSFLGLPQFSVPMGFAPSGRPQGMMLMAPTYYREAEIFGYAYAFEQSGPQRRPPALTPPLPGETLRFSPGRKPAPVARDTLRVRVGSRLAPAAAGTFRARGTVSAEDDLAFLRVFVNGKAVPVARTGNEWTARVSRAAFRRLVRPNERTAYVMAWAKDATGRSSARGVTARIVRR